MNRITVVGKLARDAELVKLNGDERMVVFHLVDYGLPNKKTSPMVIEVHFLKKIVQSIYPDLQKGKEVVIAGFLDEKRYTDSKGEAHFKKYINAEIVQFTGNKREASDIGAETKNVETAV